MKNLLNRFVLIGILLIGIGMAGPGWSELGVARFDYWLNITGGTIADLTGIDAYPDNPDGGFTTTSMVGPRQFDESYGARLSAYLIAPVTGNYTFWIASDDAGELWLSRDDNPANIKKICEVTTYVESNAFDTYPEQKSGLIALQAGEIYYIMALVKENTGEDNLSVAWSYPGQERLIIGGNVIADSNPRLASQPSPVDWAGDIPIEGVDLSWIGPLEGFVDNPAYDVYLYSDPNNPIQLLENSTETTVSTGALDYETAYIWRVDVRDPNNGVPVIRTGKLWHFTSVSPKPFITQQPQNTWVEAGGDATLTIEAEVPVAEYPITGYAWFEVSDPNNPVATTQNLALTNITSDASYYCEVTNANGTVTSQIANVIIKLTIAHWPFEGNFTDIAGEHDGTALGTGTPTFTQGVIGQAVELNGTDQYIQVPWSADLNPTSSFSVSAWAYIEPASVGLYRTVVSCRDDGPQRGYILYATDANIWSYWTGPGWNATNGSTVATGVWNFLVITFDVTQRVSDTQIIGNKSLFINGELAAQTLGETMDLNTLRAFQIGAGANEGASKNYFLDGLIDDVRFFNYALDAREVAQMYVDVYEDAVICLSYSPYDLNEDCVVDFLDLQALVANWMECNLIPECQ